MAALEEGRQAVGVAEISREAMPLAGGWLCYGGPGSWQNQAVGLGMAGPVTDADLDALVAYYAVRGVEPAIVVCPHAHESLVRGVGQRGFRVAVFENVLYRALGADVDALAPEHGWPDGLVIREVDLADADEVKTYVDVSTSGFRLPGAPISATDDEGARAMLAHPRCLGLLALLDGVPVGGSAIEIAGEIAALMATSVLPEGRRRGVQQALMIERLRRARSAGAIVATVQSRPGIPTERNAARLGFHVAYTRAELTRSGAPLT